MPSDTYTLTISDVGVSTPADGSVTTVKIADYNSLIAGTGVTTAKIVDGAITSAKIANGTIEGVDISDGAITSIKIANGTVTGTDIATGTITSSNILDGTIAEGDIANGAVTTDKIGTGTIVNNNIASNTIDLGKIAQISAGRILGNAETGTANVVASPCTAFGFQMLAATDNIGGRSALGLGSMATQASTAVAITGGTISGVTLSGASADLNTSTGLLSALKGGTGFSSYTAGDLLYASSTTALSRVTKGAENLVLRSPTTGGNAPQWGPLNLATDVTGILPTINGGTGGATTDTLTFATTGLSTDALTEGELRWNSTDKTLDLKLAGGVTLQVGQESNIYVHNTQGTIIPNGSVVYIFGSTSVDGGAVPAIKLATNADGTAKKTLGVTTQEIPVNGYGYVTTQGLVRQLDTTAYLAGTPLYLGIGGALTNTEPAYPATSVRVAISVFSDTDNGSIYVQPQLFSDGRVSGTFQWGTATAAGSPQTVTGLSSASEVIIQQRGNSVVSSFYSVVCSTDQFTPYAVAGSGGAGALPIATTEFSYIAFI